MKKNESSFAKFKAMTFFGPDGARVANPSLELLEEVIFRKPGKYWKGGDTSLSVVEHISPTEYAVIDKEPSLIFFLVPKHGFMFIFVGQGHYGAEQWVPFAG